jgi:hypothetical protein|tara:strand:- start:119 stop:862 length:744 start_codon:yes stop_codon:yes gene_type:complete
MESKFNLPTETVDLPSKGLLYPEDSPLASGVLEMKYMTAKEEDILTNQNYIKNGTVIDKLLQSLIVSKDIKINDLLIGDKNAIMIAARILSYGKDYKVQFSGEDVVIDLSLLENKIINEDLFENRKNHFTFALPTTGNTVTFQLLTHADEKNIEREIEGRKKLNKDASTQVTTRLSYIITSINGLSEKKDVREFVNDFLLAKDARALREYYSEVSPDVNIQHTYTDDAGREEVLDIPIGIDFFWPDV